MICVSIAEKTADGCIRALRGLELAEIRIDALEPSEQSPEKIRRIFSQPLKLIATCRPGQIPDNERKSLLLAAVECKAAYVDVEVDSPDGFLKEVVGKARAAGCKVIISYHDYRKTPSASELERIAEWCFESGADIAKIACLSNSEADNARLLGLLDYGKPLIVIGMGPKGRLTRVVAPLLGSPFTYASAKAGSETAPGQMDAERIRKLMDELGGLA